MLATELQLTVNTTMCWQASTHTLLDVGALQPLQVTFSDALLIKDHAEQNHSLFNKKIKQPFKKNDFLIS